jgi:hypothetical protein
MGWMKISAPPGETIAISSRLMEVFCGQIEKETAGAVSFFLFFMGLHNRFYFGVGYLFKVGAGDFKNRVGIPGGRPDLGEVQ